MRLTLRTVVIPGLVVALAACAQAGARAPATPPPGPVTPDHVPSLIADAVVLTMREGHYQPRPVDDVLSREWLAAYLKNLDSGRIYFNGADVAEFEKFADRLDDDALANPPALGLERIVIERYQLRARERVDFALKTLAENAFRFDQVGASVDLERDEKDAYAADAAALDALWRPRVAAQVLDLELAGKTRAEAIAQLDRRFKRLQRDVEGIKSLDALEIYLSSFTTLFDPHSQWLKPAEKRNFDIEMRDTLTGIGAVLTTIDGYVTIRELIPGGPAELGGELAAKDQILAVAQGDGDAVDVVEMRLDEVVEMIRGPAGTTVVLTVHPGEAADPSEQKIVRILRATVKVAGSAAKGEVREINGEVVGVVDVPAFYVDSEGRQAGKPDYGSTTRDVERIFSDFKSQGVNTVVIDLRTNGGGSLDEAVSLTGLFLPGGPVVQIRDGRGKVEALRDNDPSVVWSGPLVVLTSEASASASEIFAGAVQDYGLGIVVGAKSTHGKGSVQNLMALEPLLARAGLRDLSVLTDGAGAVKFTTHMFYRVNGASTQLMGVESDIILPSPFEGLEWKESDLDHPLPWHRIAPASYKARPFEADLAALRKASAERVAQSMGFAFLQEDLLTRAELEEREVLSLDMAQRKAEIERVRTIEDNRKRAWEAEGFDPEEPPDVILEEATLIAVDLAKALRG